MLHQKKAKNVIDVFKMSWLPQKIKKFKHSPVIHVLRIEGLHGWLYNLLCSHEIQVGRGSLEYELK